MSHHMIEHLRARTSLYYKMLFFWKVLPLHNYTSWFLLSYRNTVVNISASVCVSVPRNKVCKNPSISKLAQTVSPPPRRKAPPPPPPPAKQYCSFVLSSTFQLNYYFLVLKFLHRHIRLLHNYLTIKLIINKAQFSLVKTNLYRIEKVQNKSRCMYCRLPLENKKMKRDIINSESTKMTRKCKVGLCMPYQVDNNKSFHLVRVTCVYLYNY